MSERENIDQLFLIVHPRHVSAWTRLSPRIKPLSRAVPIPHAGNNAGILIGMDMRALRREFNDLSAEPISPGIRYIRSAGVTSFAGNSYRPSAAERRKILDAHPEIEAALRYREITPAPD